MVLLTPSIDLFLLLSVLIALPWLYLTLPARHYGNTARVQDERDNPPQPQTRKLLAIFVALHSVYILYKLIVLAPLNVFTLLRRPLNESSDNIRQLLLRKASVSVLSNSLEVLFTRLQSFDARVAYVRFGHSVVLDCEHCTSVDGFALYALPRPLLEYVRMASVVGLLTIRGSGRERWRFWALASLTIAAMAELYFVLSTEVTISANLNQTTMIHDTALQLRRVFFLLLPPLLYTIPPRRGKYYPLQALPDLVVRAERTRARLQLLRLTSAARVRHPELRTSADEFWAVQRREGQCALRDPGLREMAQNLSIGLEHESGNRDDDGNAQDSKSLRFRARATVEVLQNGFRSRN